MKSLTNQIIISNPKMNDSFFSKSVIYIYQHNLDGAFGFIINKRLNTVKVNVAAEVLTKRGIIIEDLTNNLYVGGPITLRGGIILYQKGNLSSKLVDTLNIADITNNINEKFSSDSNQIDSYKFMFGYSAWSSGQLENEIKNGDWFLQESTSDFIFNIPTSHLWEQAISSAGLNLDFPVSNFGQA